jgi:hypothetical protein
MRKITTHQAEAISSTTKKALWAAGLAICITGCKSPLRPSPNLDTVALTVVVQPEAQPSPVTASNVVCAPYTSGRVSVLPPDAKGLFLSFITCDIGYVHDPSDTTHPTSLIPTQNSCTIQILRGNTVKLVASTPNDPFGRFEGFTGDCVGPGPACTLTVDAPKIVFATFCSLIP